MPPQHSKKLAEAYYSPDPRHSPWHNDNPWTIMAAAQAGSLADIEFEKLSNDLIPDNFNDPDRAQRTAEIKARKIVLQKYGLPAKWKPTENLGLTVTYNRSHVDVLAGPEMMDSMLALNDCLQSESGPPVFRGCYPTALRDQ